MKSKALVALSFCAIFGVTGCYSLDTGVVERDESGQVTAPAEFDAMNIGVGDCANYPKEQEKASEEESYSFSEITCCPAAASTTWKRTPQPIFPTAIFPATPRSSLWQKSSVTTNSPGS